MDWTQQEIEEVDFIQFMKTAKDPFAECVELETGVQAAWRAGEWEPKDADESGEESDSLEDAALAKIVAAAVKKREKAKKREEGRAKRSKMQASAPPLPPNTAPTKIVSQGSQEYSSPSAALFSPSTDIVIDNKNSSTLYPASSSHTSPPIHYATSLASNSFEGDQTVTSNHSRQRGKTRHSRRERPRPRTSGGLYDVEPAWDVAQPWLSPASQDQGVASSNSWNDYYSNSPQDSFSHGAEAYDSAETKGRYQGEDINWNHSFQSPYQMQNSYSGPSFSQFLTSPSPNLNLAVEPFAHDTTRPSLGSQSFSTSAHDQRETEFENTAFSGVRTTTAKLTSDTSNETTSRYFSRHEVDGDKRKRKKLNPKSG